MYDKTSHENNYAKITKDYCLSLKPSPEYENPTLHIHDEYELLLCLSDNMICRVNGKQYNVEHDTLLLFNSMDLHQFGPKEHGIENHRFVFYFKPSYLESMVIGQPDLYACFLFRPYPDCNILPRTPEQSNTLQTQFYKIHSLEKTPEEVCFGKEFHIHLLIFELLLIVNRVFRIFYNIPNCILSCNYQQIYRIIEYIHYNYSDEINLDILARDFYINKYTLCKGFREVTGFTPRQYLINWRIAKARYLLLNGQSVDSACSESGFNNLSHFSRTFKRIVGLSPKQFQQKGHNRK